ncbi:endonuclease/exonuclease/phosphatase family metal-dependent hydrolase [Arcanobacterium pluranimalium]|uniref:endonuclease/exonuclease/phosphatase family protein n=1 Tax=Arcanobacterium pluranimalium TaxID=108028 RepID=UPI001957D458|nr:endonuclease/exonuclease/phosphatase family protein [Arcanobacterium pluranimalium]MBM7824207.1 endonuclease/exonuclease/phosphatase family metal-dependent hydrolase [Arcanobacterium pluranimalium]
MTENSATEYPEYVRVCTFNMQYGKPALALSNDSDRSDRSDRDSGPTARAVDFLQAKFAEMPRRDALEVFAAELAQLNPDIVLLQEVDDVRMRSTLIPQADLIADLLEMDRYFIPVERSVLGSPASSFVPWRRRGAYGLAILSRYPMRGCLKLALPEKTEFLRHSAQKTKGINGWYVHVTEPRACAYAVIDIPGKPSLVVGNTHLSTKYSAACEQLAVAAGGFQVLSERNGIQDGRFLLGGDFNLGSESVDELLSTEVVLSDFVSLATGNTYPSDAPEKQIDFLLGSGLSAAQMRTERFSISDHRALIADLRFDDDGDAA